MKERPILFNGAMVRAVLDGKKTQTRRTKGLEYFSKPENDTEGWHFARIRDGVAYFYYRNSPQEREVVCPYGMPGDRLWVREAFCASSFYDACKPSEIDPGAGLRYPADGPSIGCKTRSSIHMPRWASRITLEITGVRVERLRDISEADCRAEGCHGMHGSIPGYPYSATPSEHFRHICQSTGGNWAANPWVWVVEFRRIEP
jgi:hypothetical protein